MNKKELPLLIVQSIVDSRNELRKRASENIGVIIESKDDNSIIKFIDFDNTSTFYFILKNITLNSSDNALYAEVTILPAVVHNLEQKGFRVKINELYDKFSTWIGLIKNYNQLALDEEEKFKPFDENEFYSEFEIVDDDAEIAPFSAEKQILIYDYVSNLIEVLESKEQDVLTSQIITDSRFLADNIHKESKKEVTKRLAKIFAKIKRKGVKFMKEVLKETKKELIKRAISGAFDSIGNLITN